MSRIPGKLSSADAETLAELVDGRNVLQLGCYCGKALAVVALHAAATWVLEDLLGYPGGIEGVAEELKANVEKNVPDGAKVNLLYGVPSGWRVMDGADQLPVDQQADQHSADQQAEDLRSGFVDVVYRDADRPEALRPADDDLALNLLRGRGGVYAWHDESHALKWLRIEPVPVEVN